MVRSAEKEARDRALRSRDGGLKNFNRAEELEGREGLYWGI